MPRKKLSPHERLKRLQGTMLSPQDIGKRLRKQKEKSD
jgi:hypothetical protein